MKMTDIDYAKAKGVRKSQLDLLAISPAMAQQGFKEQTDAMIFGSLLHCMVLEPHRFDAEYFIMPKVDLRTKAGKEAQADYIANAQGKQVITADSLDMATEMRENVMMVIGDYLDDERVVIENAFFWDDPITGVHCKCKPDILLPHLGVAIDLKTTSGYATADDFAKSVRSYRYHVQDAFYSEGLKANGIEIAEFCFAPVSKKDNVCRVFNLDQSVRVFGKQLMNRDLNTWANCQTAGTWERSPSKVETIKFKPWELPE